VLVATALQGNVLVVFVAMAQVMAAVEQADIVELVVLVVGLYLMELRELGAQAAAAVVLIVDIGVVVMAAASVYMALEPVVQVAS
jgi:hypothetical protein